MEASWGTHEAMGYALAMEPKEKWLALGTWARKKIISAGCKSNWRMQEQQRVQWDQRSQETGPSILEEGGNRALRVYVTCLLCWQRAGWNLKEYLKRPILLQSLKYTLNKTFFQTEHLHWRWLHYKFPWSSPPPHPPPTHTHLVQERTIHRKDMASGTIPFKNNSNTSL